METGKKRNVEDLGVGGRILLKLSLKLYGVACTG